MPKPLVEIRERLLRAGLAPRHVRRYLRELEDHLADLRSEERRAGGSLPSSESAALERIGGVDELCRAMTEKRRFQSLCVRAPWATFTIVPLVILAGAYLVACMVLWSGWRLFLPESSAPFVPLHGLAIVYFGFGKLVYFCAPIWVGLGVAIVAVRQRLETFWCTLGLALTALAGGMAQVHTKAAEVVGRAGRVSMDFTLGPSGQEISFALIHTLAIFSLSLLPCLVWRFQRACLRSA
jgi:hypothetical protein